MTKKPAAWRSYEEVARFLVEKIQDKLGVNTVEGKQDVPADTGEWEIDGKALRDADGALIILECRRNTTKGQTREQLAAIAYRIGDIGAEGAILVTPRPIQSGARAIAQKENIKEVHMRADSTMTDYMISFLNDVFVGSSDAATATESESVIDVTDPENPRQIYP